MKIKIGWKLGFTYLLLIAIAMITLGMFILDDFQANYLAASRENLLRYGNVIANQSAPFLREGGNYDYLDFLSRDYSQQTGNRIIIVDMNMMVVADSAGEQVDKRLETPEVTQAIKGKTASQVYNLTDIGTVLYLAVPIASGQQRLGAVFIAADVNHLVAQVDSLRERLSIFGASTGIVIFVLSLLLAKIITRPLGRLQRGVQEMEAGNYGAQVEEKGNDEFSNLSTAFNQMSTKIATEDRVRKQFVANASHELKSPLASIKALVEASQGEFLGEKETKELLGDINQEIDRLDKLVGDLLLLSRIENNKQSLRLEEDSVGELVQQVVKKLEPLAAQKRVTVKLITKGELYWLMDGEMIFRALFNLMDNGIKYSHPDGIVEVGYAKEEDQLAIWVSDRGIGMEEGEQQKIFDRFYRLDKDRSRDTGGSGLGLAIGAEIISLHGGSISVDSFLGSGSTFKIMLPKKNA